jgi:hypothetical protein
MMDHPVGISSNQKQIVIDLRVSPAADQISQQPHLLNIAAKVLATSRIVGKHTWLTKDTGTPVGNSDVIQTNETDTIYYAQRQRSDEFTRFVKNKRLAPTSVMSIELTSDDGVKYYIQQIVIGLRYPSPPEAGQENKVSADFWSNHALLWGDWPVKSTSITKNCPW